MFDIIIIGGGINGAGIARDAAGRGLNVCLVEKNKIGSATSSWSTKLIHGGLRYLENFEFKLVRESLKEREIIKKIAPQIVTEVPFVLPHAPGLRSKWQIKLGFLLYDRLGGKSSIQKSSIIKLSNQYSELLNESFDTGFKYFDLQVDDKKLTELNAHDARIKKAKILENTEICNVSRKPKHWEILLNNNQSVKSKILINATGPWVDEVQNNLIKINTKKKLRLVKGSHIITKKIHNYECALTLQNYDKRVIFVIPYKNNTTLIGTTEVEVNNPDQNFIDEEEINYLVKSVNIYLKYPISKNDIISTYSGIRPLIEDNNLIASKITRDYVFDINTNDNLAPILTIAAPPLKEAEISELFSDFDALNCKISIVPYTTSAT